jgi:hypothetical protein
MAAAWQDDFLAFLRDVGPRPTPQHTLDRIDNNGHYEPGNVRWATAKEQFENRGAMSDARQQIDALQARVAELEGQLMDVPALVAELRAARAVMDAADHVINGRGVHSELRSALTAYRQRYGEAR